MSAQAIPPPILAIAEELMLAANTYAFGTLRWDFIGMVINCMLLGVVVTMYIKYINEEHEHLTERKAISGLMVITTAATAILVWRMYDLTVTNYALPNELLHATLWVRNIFPCFMLPAYLITAYIYAKRLIGLTGNQRWMQVLTFFLLFVITFLSIGTTVILFKMPALTADFFDPELQNQLVVMNTYNFKWRPWWVTIFVFTPLIDSILCIATIWTIVRQKSQTFSRTKSLLNRVILVSLRSMVLPAVGYFCVLLLFLFNWNGNNQECVLGYIDKLGLISLFSLFAERKTMRARLNNSTIEGVSIHLSQTHPQLFNNSITPSVPVPGATISPREYNQAMRKMSDGSVGLHDGEKGWANETSSRGTIAPLHPEES